MAVADRKWVSVRDPEVKYGGTMILGEREVKLPRGAVISVTRGEDLSLPRTIINMILTQFIKKAMTKNDNLLYAELTGRIDGGGMGQTLTVWKSGDRVNAFRVKGRHNFARKFFGWVFYSGKAQAYFLTWKADGVIPTAEEAALIVKEHGRYFDGGKLVKKASPPQRKVERKG